MGFLGKVFSGIGNAIKSFATSTLGSTLLKAAGGFFLGPLAPTLIGAATNLLKNGFNAKNLIKTGLNLFGGLATGGFGGGTFDAVKKLASSVLPSTGLGGLAKTVLGGVLNGKGVSGILSDVFQNTEIGKNLGGKIGSVIGTVSKFVNTGSSILNKVTDTSSKISSFLGSVGIKPPAFLDNLSQKLGSVGNAFTKIQGFIESANGILGGGTANMLRA